ncbi:MULTISPECIES: UDP-3-O-(3-hydroxymyristoyl)glucosamine N-acyltransferase [Persicobacter]|uniref:UDP-3-O-acylglucosamine N-acyltransferase n=1 Tax=Persicobacter diffluens TaxID=981 RepID=A0AAN4VYJ1_9BACT|nr:UDP-3-O-(3-hydroxymyristoyl)glucosamine N-acyltransferase [Persicobacter sp. CCB-QB2]GJM61594.1 UDP-3-O-acylglucosamine N-acyltransferase [Persicobacter diffluens]
MEFTLNQIAAVLGGTIEGDGDKTVNTIGKIEEAGPEAISFLSNPKYENYLYTSNAGGVIVNEDFEPKQSFSTTLIRVKNAYSSFTALLEEVDKFQRNAKTGVEEPSFIGEGSTMGENGYRAAFSYVGQNVKMGTNVKIYPHAAIGDNVTIGDNTVIDAGAKVYKDSVIGKNCYIHANAVIGSDGFGFAPQEDGTYKRIPQMGNVILEDNVSVGANTVVDCATMGSTIIKEGAKLDNLIQVAHNVSIGKNSVIAAQTGISGSSKIGDGATIAGQVGVAGHLQLADKVSIGAQAGILKSVKEEGAVLMGSPAYNLKDYLRSYSVFKKLPQLEAELKELKENT